jgi:hypothetical protein
MKPGYQRQLPMEDSSKKDQILQFFIPGLGSTDTFYVVVYKCPLVFVIIEGFDQYPSCNLQMSDGNDD